MNHVEEVAEKQNGSASMPVSWAAFHCNSQPTVDKPKSTIALLPIFKDQAHLGAMILHNMNSVKTVVAYLNPGQTPVLTADQPLYALAKLIQWNFPEIHPEDSFIVVFGSLYIKMNILKVLGNWL